ncbi:small conductance calcium-activated potassium channel protein 1-like [Hippocampus zosterae]|uniref:small conductance calcium-activated potassium channel protein 1-like n=1 Tax=Hippocampus zosterae TaxID=109293 RepID=UPI00223E5A15|nr:small conductance calcium-activated potassium channel protein 1-like [Hippocampus zosterae]XP_051926101.1 small conductance calcium-activated potassium channel protein 1-like [Hippocampus zosterae]
MERSSSTSTVNICPPPPAGTLSPRLGHPPACGTHPGRAAWPDRTRAAAAAPLYNGQLCARAWPRSPQRAECKEKRRQARSGKERARKSAGASGPREKGCAFHDGAPAKSSGGPPRPPPSSETGRSLPEIWIGGVDDEAPPPGKESAADRERGLLPGAPRNCSPERKGRAKEERHWRTHSIGWRLVRRRALFLRRRRLNDCALAVGMFGVLLMVLETELSWSVYSKSSVYSLSLKSVISLSTVVLLGLIVAYHCCEVQLYVHDSGAEDWRVAVTTERLALIALELAAAAIHPYPAGLPAYLRRRAAPSETELEIALALPMFLRLYLPARAMMLHSGLFTDTASRSIGALNKIHFNARFVGKTMMTTYPGTVLMIFSVSLWILAAWGLHVCERHHNYRDLSSNYMEALWMVSVTFLSIGYGDVVPHTYCGRSICLLTGIMGAGCTVLVVAVVARKLELTRAEKHVHNFMIDSHISKRMKIAAANVVRETWLIYKHTKLSREKDHTMVRTHQRKLMLAIHQLRRVKMDKRILADQGGAPVDLCKLETALSDVLAEVRGCRDQLDAHVRGLEKHVDELREGFRGLMPLLTSTLSTQNSSIRHLLRQREKVHAAARQEDR